MHYSQRVFQMVSSHYSSLQPADGYGYLHLPAPFSDLLCGFLVALMPITVIGLFQLRLRSLDDFRSGTVGVLKGVAAT